MTASKDSRINVKVFLSGGLELLFAKQRSLTIEMPESSSIKDLIQNMRIRMSDKREELFIQDETVRPGILVLINDADWELEGEEAYVLQDNDEILFVSTLHGG